MDTRKTILIYQYSERIKSGLIIAFNLLAKMSSLQGKELFGAEKLMVSYLEALLAEIRIAQNVEKSEHFLKAERKVMEAMGRLQLHEYKNINRDLSQAMSSITTSCQISMDALEEKNLL